MALLNEPKILLLDEPTVGLDIQSAKLIREMLRELNQEGVTIFLTTHNMEEANQLCERLAIINHGMIAAIDRPENLKMMEVGPNLIEVAFDKPVEIESLSKLSTLIQAKKMGDKIRLYTEDTNGSICQIVDYAKANELRFVSLNVLAPSLEDVFIKLIEGSEEKQ
jgi:ABC-2 type transport system ATP-binding protein